MFQPFSHDMSVPVSRNVGTDRAGAVALMFVAAMLFTLSTHRGIGILPDSTRYMSLAPQPWDAPLYPALLYAVATAGIDIATAAWGIGLALTVLNTLFVWIILRETCLRADYAGVGTALIVIAPHTVGIHAAAMSEPLFLTMILATLVFVVRYLQSDDRRWLLVTGIGVGLASLVRFTGPSLGAAIALGLLLDPRHRFPRRISDVMRVLLPSVLLFLGWAVLSEWVVGRSTGRPLQWYGGITADKLLASFTSLTSWIAPDEVPFAIRSIVLVAAFVVSAFLLIRHTKSRLLKLRGGKADPSLLALVLGIFLPAYLAFFALAVSVEANLHLNSRYAFPIYCTTIMAMTIVLADAREARGWPNRLHGLLLGLAMLMLVGHAIRTVVRTERAFNEGIGYAALRWTQSPTLAAVSQLPCDTILYSNGPDAIGYVLRRKARAIPAHVMLRTGREDPSFPYPAQLAGVRAALAHGNAYVVILHGVDWRFYMASEAELVRRLHLNLVARRADGRIYAGAQAAAGPGTPRIATSGE